MDGCKHRQSQLLFNEPILTHTEIDTFTHRFSDQLILDATPLPSMHGTTTLNMSHKTDIDALIY